MRAARGRELLSGCDGDQDAEWQPGDSETAGNGRAIWSVHLLKTARRLRALQGLGA